MDFFAIDKRKQYTKIIIQKMRDWLYKISGDDIISAYILILFHWFITGIAIAYIIFGSIDKWFIISILIWSLMVLMHFYFNGCIFVRVEKALMESGNSNGNSNSASTEKWWGPWIFPFTLLEKYFNIKMTGRLANNIFICWGILFSAFILLKGIYTPFK